MTEEALCWLWFVLPPERDTAYVCTYVRTVCTVTLHSPSTQESAGRRAEIFCLGRRMYLNANYPKEKKKNRGACTVRRIY
jgi:hypothetical protein